VLKHWLIDLVGHVSGLSEAQLGQIEKALPRTKALGQWVHDASFLELMALGRRRPLPSSDADGATHK
jgi:hypothetical protein